MHNREHFLRKIMEYSFAENEWNLYLDTHPYDKNGIAIHADISKKLNELEKAYEEKYGPLTSRKSNNKDKWDWLDGPWPID